MTQTLIFGYVCAEGVCGRRGIYLVQHKILSGRSSTIYSCMYMRFIEIFIVNKHKLGIYFVLKNYTLF